MKKRLDLTLVLCDLDGLLLGPDGRLLPSVQQVLPLFLNRGGCLTVFSQRSPRAVQAALGMSRLAAPALVCGGTLACRIEDGSTRPLCSFAGLEETVINKLPSAVGLGIALQMADGSARVLRMSDTLEGHLRAERTPYVLGNAADCRGADVVRVLLYQDRRQMPLLALLNETLGAAAQKLRTERIAPDTLALTPCEVSAVTMFNAVCPPAGWTAQQLLVLANCPQLTGLMRLAGESVVPADASDALRQAAARTALTDHDTGAAAEVLYTLIRGAEG